MKNKEIFIKLSLFASLGFTIMSAMLKTSHWNEANVIMAIGLLAYIIFLILTISEVSNSETISKNEKIMWITGLIMISQIVGYIYIYSARKRIYKTKDS